MSNDDLANIATTLMADGKGILAADETVGTLTKRFDALGIRSTEQPGIVFLSGGQRDQLATAHLDAINRLPGPKPWKISFSYGRALQDPALETWHGREENLRSARQSLAQRARCNGAASRGTYTEEMETKSAGVATPAPRREGHDD